MIFNTLTSWIKDKYWWLRWRTCDKYHVVNTGLEPGYYDKDFQMQCAMMSLLEDYVEKELPAISCDKYNTPQEAGIAHLDWEIGLQDSPSQAEAAKEVKQIYLWWKEHKERIYEDDYELPSVDEELTEMLVRLVRIRRCLWT